jgi:hypothetical protein
MKEIKTLLNRGWDNLSPNEQRDVVTSLAEHLGSTEASVRNWIGGGMPRKVVDKPQSYRNLPKKDWFLLRDIFAICCDGKVFEEKKEVKKNYSKMSSKELMAKIDKMSSNIRRTFFRGLYMSDRDLYNEVSNLYSLHKKYEGSSKANLNRYAKINKKEIIKNREAEMLQNLQNGGKIRL